MDFTKEKKMAPANAVFCGVDEAGRGPLVGRVYAAAVILPPAAENDPDLAALNDSKKLSEKKRMILAEHIKKIAVSYAVTYNEPETIDRINILQASLDCMERAIDLLDPKPAFAFIDGNKTGGITTPCRAVVGGDALLPSVAAASILAKTERDKYCVEVLDKLYPAYGFAVHKGYGTKAHYDAIARLGLCPAHRVSFFKNGKHPIGGHDAK